MHNSSISTSPREPSLIYDLVSHLGRLAFTSSRFHNPASSAALLSNNFLYFDGLGRQHPKVTASLSLNAKGSASRIRRIATEFNRAIRFHCDKFPIGFASLGIGDGNNNGSGEGDINLSGLRENGSGGGGSSNDKDVVLNADRPKKVLILMSDTGGGHRASAEAIKAAFNEEYGDEYQVFVTDLWSEHTPWPFNQLPRSYNFLPEDRWRSQKNISAKAKI